MRLTFTLDEVFRAKIKQFGLIYRKYIDKNIALEDLDFSSGDLEKVFNFKSKEDFNKFLYQDYAFEVFGEATTPEKAVDKKFNLWHLAMLDNPDVCKIELALSNPYEFNNSIGFSYFFISKIATRIRKVFFPTDWADIWEQSDVLVTADPNLLRNKPEGKISVKIITDCNADIPADVEYDGLEALLDDADFFIKIGAQERKEIEAPEETNEQENNNEDKEKEDNNEKD